MKQKWILPAIIVIALATTSATYGDTLTTEEQNFRSAFETFRTKYNLDVPMLDESLVSGSRSWSLRMRQTGSFQHGASMENIYRGSASGVAAFRAWERSPAHRSLLLSPNIGAFGIGNDGNLWTFRARTRVVERAESAVQANSVVRTNNSVRTVQPVVVRSSQTSFVPRALLLKRHCCR